MRYKFTPKQSELLSTLPLPFDFDSRLTAKQSEVLWEAVEHHLQTKGLQNDDVNEVGRICESILDSLYDQEEAK